jgi:hypothetical protein
LENGYPLFPQDAPLGRISLNCAFKPGSEVERRMIAGEIEVQGFELIVHPASGGNIGAYTVAASLIELEPSFKQYRQCFIRPGYALWRTINGMRQQNLLRHVAGLQLKVYFADAQGRSAGSTLTEARPFTINKK